MDIVQLSDALTPQREHPRLYYIQVLFYVKVVMVCAGAYSVVQTDRILRSVH